MTDVLYHIATTMVAPGAAAWMAAHPRLRPLLGRFNPPVPIEGAVWLQACSVGEVAVAAALMRGIHERWPELPRLLTVSTLAGYERAGTLKDDLPVTWFPFDQRASVRRFVQRASPRLLALVETEIWPNVIRESFLRGVPTVLVNARISDRHFPRYLRYRPLLRPTFERITAAGAQNQIYAERLERLGMRPESIQVTGNTKFDGLTTAIEPAVQDRIRAETGLDGAGPVIVFGSTRPGDEALAVRCWQKTKQAHPNARLVVAPRHVERVPEILPLFDEPVLLRSRCAGAEQHSSARVLLVDTLGELVMFYSLASVAVVGGSFYPGVNGHNPLEPAALGIPTIFGPFMSNFIDPAQVLVASGGALQVRDADSLSAALESVLTDPQRGHALAGGARAAIASNQGAVGRTLDLLGTLLTQQSRQNTEKNGGLRV